MNYSIRFFKSAVQGVVPLEKTKAEEIVLKYEHDTNEIIEFLYKDFYCNRKIVLDLTTYEDSFSEESKTILKNVHEMKNNTTLKINFWDTEIIDFAKQEDIRYFFPVPVENWSALKDMAESGVSEIYISSELGFDLPIVSEYCHEKNIEIRVVPNTAINDFQKSMPSNFFIRPDDLALYEGIIDTVEFACALDKQPTYHKIYRQVYWHSYLSEIIVNDNEDAFHILNDTIDLSFGKRRMSCGRSCVNLNWGKCTFCKNYFDLAEVLTNTPLRIKK